MYCSACGTPVTSGLSFCNRCGTSLKEKHEGKASGIAGGLITAVVLVAIFGLGIMFGGAIALKKGGDLNMDIVGLFMLFTFLIVGTVEVFLLRQLSRLLGDAGRPHRVAPAPPLFQPSSVPANEVRAAPLRALPEPIPSVTENTTRTLANSFRESPR